MFAPCNHGCCPNSHACLEEAAVLRPLCLANVLPSPCSPSARQRHGWACHEHTAHAESRRILSPNSLSSLRPRQARDCEMVIHGKPKSQRAFLLEQVGDNLTTKRTTRGCRSSHLCDIKLATTVTAGSCCVCSRRRVYVALIGCCLLLPSRFFGLGAENSRLDLGAGPSAG